MAFSIVNVILRDEDAVRGRDEGAASLIRQIVEDGYEPFSTAGADGVGLVMSFRLWHYEPIGDGTDVGLLPGYL